MKKFLLSVSLLAGAVLMVNAQDLPKIDFLAGYSVGQDLDKGEYANTTQTTDPEGVSAIKENQWTLTGKAADKTSTIEQATIVSSSIDYATSGYAGGDNNNLAIQLNKLTTGTRLSIYSLADATSNTPTYDEGAYYAAFMFKPEVISSGNGADFFMFCGNYTGDQQRGRVFVRNGSEGTKFIFGLSEQSAPTNTSVPVTGDLDKTGSYLLVLKYDFTNSKITLFVDPAIAANEPAAGANVLTVSTTNLSSIRGIAVRERNSFSAEIGGIRFSDNWVEAVGYDATSIAGETADKGNVVSVKYFNLNGVEVNEPVNTNSVYVKKAVYEDGSVETTKVIK